MNSTSIPASRKVCAFQTSEKKPRSSPNLRGWRIFTSAISVVSTCIVTYVPYHPYYPDLLNNIAELPGDIKLTPPVARVFMPRSRAVYFRGIGPNTQIPGSSQDPTPDCYIFSKIPPMSLGIVPGHYGIFLSCNII